ncbi:MAG: hypothetical protein ACRD9L_04825 [Bryobacteraceae bacterium]
MQAAKFLHMQHIYRIFDLPYQSQIVPLAAILADIGDAGEHDANRAKLIRWYWNGVFGELYGSTVETRIARDFMEVPGWLTDGWEPVHGQAKRSSVPTDAHAPLRCLQGHQRPSDEGGAQNFRSGQKFDHTVFFGENVDIHHIFRRNWCKTHRIKSKVYDSIISKTTLFLPDESDHRRRRAIGISRQARERK